MDKGVHGSVIQVTTTSTGLPNLLHLGLRQPHPISDTPSSAITLFSLKQSSLFKIKGRNMGHIFSSVFLAPPEWASRGHLWDPAITSPKVWTKIEAFRAYLWMWSCFQNITVFTVSLKEECTLIHHSETLQDHTAILLISAGQSVKTTSIQCFFSASASISQMCYCPWKSWVPIKFPHLAIGKPITTVTSLPSAWLLGKGN